MRMPSVVIGMTFLDGAEWVRSQGGANCSKAEVEFGLEVLGRASGSTLQGQTGMLPV